MINFFNDFFISIGHQNSYVNFSMLFRRPIKISMLKHYYIFQNNFKILKSNRHQNCPLVQNLLQNYYSLGRANVTLRHAKEKIAENTVYACVLLSAHADTHGTKGKKGTICRMSDQAITFFFELAALLRSIHSSLHLCCSELQCC